MEEKNFKFSSIRVLTRNMTINNQTQVNVTSNSSRGLRDKNEIIDIYEIIKIVAKVTIEGREHVMP